MSEEKIWERPSSVKVPTVWARYKSKRPMANGVAPVFRIQDYTEEWFDHVIHNMTNFFIKDEPISRSLKVAEDKEAVEDFKNLFCKYLDRKMGLIAIVENLEELGDKSLPILAGYNLTAVVTPHEKIECTSNKMQTILTAMHVLEEKNDGFKHYQVKEYLYALGLSVNPAFRGHGLGYEILKARLPLCKAVGIKATVTVFTAKEAQRSAEKTGFETLAELSYKEYKDETGKRIFLVDEPESMKLMGMKII